MIYSFVVKIELPDKAQSLVFNSQPVFNLRMELEMFLIEPGGKLKDQTSCVSRSSGLKETFG